MAAFYGGIAFVIVQVMDGAFPLLHIPEWIGSLVMVLILIGFPLAIGLVWTMAPRPSPADADVADSGPTGQVADSITSAGGPIKSIAVLSFTDMSPDGDQEYFGDGIAEELIDALTKIDHLQVVARSTAFSLKGKDLDIREVGRQLNVEAILEGSVRKSGDRLRVTAQLVKVSDGFHLWSERYDRDMQDFFALQDDLAQNIVRALGAVLSDSDKQVLTKAATTSIEAYDYYLRGREFFYTASLVNLEFALQMFTRATEIDPQFARAYAGLADCHTWSYLYFGAKKSKVAAAIEASQKALSIDPELAEAHVSHGWAVSLHGQFDLAESEFETAIGINAKLYEAYYFYARTCWAQGKMERAGQLFEKAAQVNPQDFQALALMTSVFEKLGHAEQVESAARRGLAIIERRLELNPDNARALYMGAGLLVLLGERDKGLNYAERAISTDPEDLTIIYNVACAHARAGNVDIAIDYLSKVLLAGFSHKEWVQNDGDLLSLQDHPRFIELLDKMPSPE